jgi:hypothetical protein
LIEWTGIRGIRAGARRVLPLRFGGQAVPVAVVSSVKLCDEFLGFQLAYRLNWTRFSFVAAGISPHDSHPLPLCDFVLPDFETLRNFDTMPRILVRSTLVVAWGASHHEFTGSDLDEFHAECIFGRLLRALCANAVSDQDQSGEGDNGNQLDALFHNRFLLNSQSTYQDLSGV